ncbi:S-adenosyl-L-methionine-dependent methyltransferase [Jimgerdemannia flammicorona]|uniref:Protein-lysine N-methyltransferase EFM4 n=1 Tax=Jimgerdemannia flammicorona TaxID=994334 RepID=A0A433DHQ5_9FUNG|nr:S-adenosyl-L-methionine-dependent methyltransferase [Jimgerdemannia flammicorona]
MAQQLNEGDFGPSELGTKVYWDRVYDRENANFEDHGDIGEVWFGEDSVEKMIDWVNCTIPDRTSSILDLGCGNGHLLLELATLSYTDLTGIDYSPLAVQLAISIAQGRDLAHIRYETVDFLADLEGVWSKGKRFDVVLDKGTYDAICLNPMQTAAQARGERGPVDRYSEAVKALIKGENGWLLLTSCNWTREELNLTITPTSGIRPLHSAARQDHKSAQSHSSQEGSTGISKWEG